MCKLAKDSKEENWRIEGELEGGMVGAFRRLLSSTSSESEGFGQKESRVAELFRRAVDRGSELRGSTEDSLKRAFFEFLTTSETIEVLLVKLDELRADASDAIRGEIEAFLSQLDLGHDIRKALDGLSIEIKTEISFKDSSPKNAAPGAED